jgi:chemotaxis protein CheD
MNKINVGIGDFAVAAEEGVLVTVLGSCVGVILYDKIHKIGGLAHVYLPDSRLGMKHEPAGEEHQLSRSLKYADLLIPRLVEEMRSRGAEKKHFLGYLVGGALLYDFPEDSSLNVGLRNLEKTRSLLSALGFRFVEVKVGGKIGRHVSFNIATGDIEVKEFSED